MQGLITVEGLSCPVGSLYGPRKAVGYPVGEAVIEKRLRTALDKLALEDWVMDQRVNAGGTLPLMVRRVPETVHEPSLARMQTRSREQSREGVCMIQLPGLKDRGASIAGKRSSQHHGILFPHSQDTTRPSCPFSSRVAVLPITFRKQITHVRKSSAGVVDSYMLDPM